LGFGACGSGFGVWGLGSKVRGLDFRVQDLVFRVHGFGVNRVYVLEPVGPQMNAPVPPGEVLELPEIVPPAEQCPTFPRYFTGPKVFRNPDMDHPFPSEIPLTRLRINVVHGNLGVT
jgi:hypothetical protein